MILCFRLCFFELAVTKIRKKMPEPQQFKQFFLFSDKIERISDKIERISDKIEIFFGNRIVS